MNRLLIARVVGLILLIEAACMLPSLAIAFLTQGADRPAFVYAVAVCGAIAALTGLSPRVKWVNDIYVAGRKVAGILAELVLDRRNVPRRVIVGVGVNLTTESFPAELDGKAGRIGAVEPERLCALIADSLADLYGQLDDNSFMKIYSSLNYCLGHEVTYSDLQGTHRATALAIGPDGSLIVEEDGTQRALHSGEISIKL